jgi:hypothetical protein
MINNNFDPAFEDEPAFTSEQVATIKFAAQGLLTMAEQIVGKWDECAEFLSTSVAENEPFFCQLFKFAEDYAEFFNDDLYQRLSSIDKSVKRIALTLRDQIDDIATTPIPMPVLG